MGQTVSQPAFGHLELVLVGCAFPAGYYGSKLLAHMGWL